MLIYLVTNLTNGKQYVGQTRLKLDWRWKQHIRDAGNGSTTLIGRAIRKYGAVAFSIAVLCTCSSQEELDAREREFISNLGTHSSTGKGYNLTAGGFGGQHGAVGPMTGKHHSLATRERMRKAHKGKKCLQRGRPNGAAHLNYDGRVATEAMRKSAKIVARNMGLGNRGKIRSVRGRAVKETGVKYSTLYMREYRAARLRYYGA